jgi:putative tryptophan/tyrosine transport system substrate-binding protein
VQQKVDLILSTGTPASHAARKATETIPIVITTVINPVGDGFAASLARPGGNVTGMASGAEDTVQKLVELLVLTVPKAQRIAVLANPNNSTHAAMLLQVQAAARKSGKQVLPVRAGTLQEIERGFMTMASERSDALIILLDGSAFLQRAQIAALALKHRLPSIYTQPQYAEAGGLMSYGADTIDNFRRAGLFVDKILKGAKPGEIPFEQPTRYYLVINRGTAKALNIRIPQTILISADKVIE